MKHDRRANLFHELEDAFAIANVEIVMAKIRVLAPQAFEVPVCIAVAAEEAAAHVVVDAVDHPAATFEEGDSLRSQQPGGAGNKYISHTALAEKCEGGGRSRRVLSRQNANRRRRGRRPSD